MKKMLVLAMFLLFAQYGYGKEDSVENKKVDYRNKIIALRKAPLSLSIGTDYFSDSPQRSALKSMMFEWVQLGAYCAELVPDPFYNLVLPVIFSGLSWYSLQTAIHEIGGHGKAYHTLYDHAKVSYEFGMSSTKKTDESQYRGWSYLWRNLLRIPKGGSTSGDYKPYSYAQIWLLWAISSEKNLKGDKRTVLLERLATAKDLEATYSVDTPAGNLSLTGKEMHDALVQNMRMSYAGINMEAEVGRYFAQRVLYGDVVRPESFWSYATCSLMMAGYPMKAEGGNDQWFIDGYYEHFGITSAVRKAKIWNVAAFLLSGSTWSFARGFFNTELVKPMWICDRVLWPNFFVFYTQKGISLLMESAVKVYGDAFVMFGAEILVEAGLDYSEKSGTRYTDKDWRLGAGFRPLPYVFIGGYTLLNNYGGAFEVSVKNPAWRMGVTVGCDWASDESLCGERVMEKPWSTKGRTSSAYVRLSVIL